MCLQAQTFCFRTVNFGTKLTKREDELRGHFKNKTIDQK